MLNFLEFEHALPHGGAKYFKAVKVQEIKFDKNAKPIGILIQPISKNIVIALTRLDEVDVYSPNCKYFFRSIKLSGKAELFLGEASVM